MPGIRFPNRHTTTVEARPRFGLLASSGPGIRLLTAGLDLIFPPRCAGCGRVDARWCDRCQRDLEQVACLARERIVDGLDGAATTGVHEGVLQTAIHALKYENVPELAQTLAARMEQVIVQLDWQIDMIAPVPLHTTRLEERGYNQSQLIGDQLARRLNSMCLPEALERSRNTPSQVGLNAQERKMNVSDAFHALPELVSGRHILLVDDVLTTGATLQACAEAARAAGAAAVYGLTVSTARD